MNSREIAKVSIDRTNYLNFCKDLRISYLIIHNSKYVLKPITNNAISGISRKLDD